MPNMAVVCISTFDSFLLVLVFVWFGLVWLWLVWFGFVCIWFQSEGENPSISGRKEEENVKKEEKQKEGEEDGTYLRTWESAERLPDILVSLKGTVCVISSHVRSCGFVKKVTWRNNLLVEVLIPFGVLSSFAWYSLHVYCSACCNCLKVVLVL